MKELKMLFSDELEKSEYPENLGKRSKLGGKPDWIQNDETPKCPKCKKPMTFICQIDSIGYTGSAKTTGEYMFGDVGMLYNFFCFDCHKANILFQEY